MGKRRSFGGGSQRQRGVADRSRGNGRVPADPGRQPPVIRPALRIHPGINVILAKQPVQFAPFFHKTAPGRTFHGVKGGDGVFGPAGLVHLPQMLPPGLLFGRTALSIQQFFQPEKLFVKSTLPPAGYQSFQKGAVLAAAAKQRHGAAFLAFFQKTAQSVGLTARGLLPDAGTGQFAEQKEKGSAKRLRQNGQLLLAERLNLLPGGQRFRQMGNTQFPSRMGQKFTGEAGDPAFSARKGRQPYAPQRQTKRSRFLLQVTTVVTEPAGCRHQRFLRQTVQKANVLFQPSESENGRQKPCGPAARLLTGQRLHPGRERVFRQVFPPGKGRFFPCAEKEQKKQRKARRGDPPLHFPKPPCRYGSNGAKSATAGKRKHAVCILLRQTYFHVNKSQPRH